MELTIFGKIVTIFVLLLGLWAGILEMRYYNNKNKGQGGKTHF